MSVGADRHTFTRMGLSITGNDPAMLISYKIYGSGRPILLIPGFASLANSWGLQYRWLKK